jgi:serine/threonine protein phosphatase PrpC
MPLRLVDSSAYTLAPDDLLILASDGVETLTMAEVAESIEHAEDDCPQRIARAIIEQVAARKFPRQDNTTLLVYRHR